MSEKTITKDELIEKLKKWQAIQEHTGKCQPNEWVTKVADFIMPSPYAHLRKGDKVLNLDGERRYFSHVDDEGRPHVFNYGKDEWSSNGEAFRTEHCELWEEERDTGVIE